MIDVIKAIQDFLETKRKIDDIKEKIRKAVNNVERAELMAQMAKLLVKMAIQKALVTLKAWLAPVWPFIVGGLAFIIIIILLLSNQESIDNAINLGLGPGSTEEELRNPTIDGDEGVVMTDEIPLFLQGDPRWGGITINGTNGLTIRSGGCGPTSLAMVLTGLSVNPKGYDFNGDRILTPDETTRFAEDKNAVCENGTYAGILFNGASSYFGVNLRTYRSGQEESVMSELQKGNPIIVNVQNRGEGRNHFTGGKHFMVLAGIKDGKVEIRNPNGMGNSQTWDISVIASELYESAGYVYWVFENPNKITQSIQAAGYSLDPQETNGIYPGEEGYGISASGINLSGADISNRYIAADVNYIPLGSKVYIKVPEEKRYQKLDNGEKVDMNGWYTSVDIGSSEKILFYMGEDEINPETHTYTPGYYKKMVQDWGTVVVQVVKK